MTIAFGFLDKLAEKEKTNMAIGKVVERFCIRSLKDEQRQNLQCILNRVGCVAVLPTGVGKFLPFQISIPVRREIGMSDVDKFMCVL